MLQLGIQAGLTILGVACIVTGVALIAYGWSWLAFVYGP